MNRYVHHQGKDTAAQEALGGFKRFPTWMWRNKEVVAFIEWVREYNAGLPTDRQVGVYGLDLYSLQTSMAEVLTYLDKIDPDAAKRARFRYSCFDHYSEDSQAYGYAAGFGLSGSCEEQVVRQLMDLHARRDEYARRDGFVAEDEFFYAEQNARLVKNAEHYYRTMFQGCVASWNLRDRHMAETLDALIAHIRRRKGDQSHPPAPGAIPPNPPQARRDARLPEGRAPSAKAVVWEHNSHIGDARATQMGEQGEFNVGQLMRERYGRQAMLIGFTTYIGTVTAASQWDGPAEQKVVRPALPDSYEALFHRIGAPDFLLCWNKATRVAEALSEPRLERAIGVIYLPETERVSHYFTARLAEQFDAVLHFDRTSAVEPLEPCPGVATGEAPETFPSGT
jgi:erythromycin esterase-like protein